MNAAAQIIFEQAEEELERGNFAIAFSFYLQFLMDRVTSSDPELVATENFTVLDMVAMERLADLAALFGWWDEAAKVLNLTIELFEQARNDCASNYIRLKLISLELNRGYIRRAVEQFKQMSPTPLDPSDIEFTDSGFAQWEDEQKWIDIGDADRAILLSRIYLEMGRLEAATGEYQRTLAALKRGLFHCQPGAPDLAQQAIIPLMLSIACAEMELGDLVSAEVALQGLPDFFNAAGRLGTDVQRLEIMGKISLLRGELGEAKRHFEDVLRICNARQFERAVALAKLNLAQVLIYLNETREASEFLLNVRDTALRYEDAALVVRSEALLRHANSRAQSLAESVSIADSVTHWWGAADEPETEKGEVIETNPLEMAIAGNYLALFEERALGFHWHLSRMDWDTASSYLEGITEIFNKTDSVLIRVRLLVLECILDYYTDRYERAVRGFEHARPLLEKMGLLPELWQVQRFIGWCMTKSGRLREAELISREAESTLNVMAESLSAVDQVFFRLNKWTAEEEYITGEINQLMRLKARVSRRNWIVRPWLRWQISKQLGALLDYVDHYKSLLVEREVKGQKASSASGARRPLWQRLLGIAHDHVTLSFLVLPDRVLVTRIGWMSLDFGVSTLTRIQVRDRVRSWHELVLLGDDNSIREAQRVMKTLAEELQISNLLDNLPERVRRLTFMPDDSLHGLPFAAIHYRGKYLVESYAVSLAFQWSDRPSVKAESGNALVVAITSKTDEYSALPGAQKELENVKQWLTNHSLSTINLINDQADKQTVLRFLPDATLFHIACHGRFEPNRPDCSGLILVSRGEVEILSLRELSGLSLPKLEQAILFACWSADNFILPGRWVISLPETLWRAGARSILGCLWEVDDTIAANFITQLYQKIDKMPRSEALRQVQLACIQCQLNGCEKVDTSDPVYWAGFTLYGDSGPLILKSSQLRAED
jgi:tetratricopeptide (TPR) repeat protein